jgi:hypothetical protein
MFILFKELFFSDVGGTDGDVAAKLNLKQKSGWL